MEEDPLELVAGYVSPLTDAQHAQIGRIAVLWGQVENFVDELLMHVSALTWDELDTLGITAKPIGAKTAFLKKVGGRQEDVAFKASLKRFCDLIGDVKDDRNHVFHGMWGFRGNSRNQTVQPAARKIAGQPQGRPSVFPVSKLATLERKLCQCSRMGFDLVLPLWGSPRARLTKYIHHDVEGAAPQWLRQWAERNRLNDEVLDGNAKSGQLHRLAKPFPQK